MKIAYQKVVERVNTIKSNKNIINVDFDNNLTDISSLLLYNSTTKIFKIYPYRYYFTINNYFVIIKIEMEKLLNYLSDLKTNFNAIGIKAEFETEGASFDDICLLKELST